MLNRIIILISTLVILSNANEKEPLMPTELVEYGDKHNCPAISEFYSLIDVIDPPFAYGIADSKRWKSAVFWCKKKNSHIMDHTLMIYLRNKSIDFKCDKEILIDNMSVPIGLRIEEKEWDLSKFTNINKKNHEDKYYSFIRSKAIILENFDVKEAYICHDGNWLNSKILH